MTKYYIKDGYEEKGPFTLEELRKQNITRTTFVRPSDNNNWFQADTLPDLSRVFTRKFHFPRILGFTFLSVIIIGVVLFAMSNNNLKSSSYQSYEDVAEPIPPPPSISYELTQHKKKFLKELFKDCNLSGEKKELVNACNYTNSIVRNNAVSIAGQSAGTYNLGQICDVFDNCYNNWKYVNDPKGSEVIEYASNTLSNGFNGDCDDFAVLVCSMILSIGGEARINFAYGANGGHAFTEVNIGNTNTDDIENYISKRYKSVYSNDGIWSRTDEDNTKWINLDWFAKHPGGKYFEYNHGTTFYIIQQYCNDFAK